MRPAPDTASVSSALAAPLPAAGPLRAPLGADAITDAPAWVEVMNDDKTPMEFVVQTLADVFALTRDDAIALMLRIHREGSVRMPCASLAQATEHAAALNERARAAGHPLACSAGGNAAT